MAVYCYTCPLCGNIQDVFRGMKNEEVVPRCDCAGALQGHEMKRDRKRELSNIAGVQKADTFWSDSLAISPDQTAEHQKLFPDVLVDKEGRVGFTSNKQRSNYLDKCGFDKKPQRIRHGKSTTRTYPRYASRAASQKGV